MTKVWPSRNSKIQTSLATHTYLRLNKALLRELWRGAVWGRGRRTKFLLREITIWNVHKSVNELCRSYQHCIFGASQLSREAPPACQHPWAAHAAQAWLHLARPGFLGSGPGSGKFLSPHRYHHTIPLVCTCLLAISLLTSCDLVGAVYKTEHYFDASFGKSAQAGKIWCSHIWRKRICSFSNEEAKSLSEHSSLLYKMFQHLQIKYCDFVDLWVWDKAWDLWRLLSSPLTTKKINKVLIVHTLLRDKTAFQM